MDESEVTNNLLEEQLDESISSSTNNQERRQEVKFSGYVLWTKYFTVDRVAKTMTCKLCSKSFPFKKSASTTIANNHLNSKKHQDYDFTYLSDDSGLLWTDGK